MSEVMTAAWAMSGLIDQCYVGDVETGRRFLDEFGADINGVQETTGLSPLHIAIGRNHLDMVRFLVERGAVIQPDRHGRWPSVIAGICEAGIEICDLVADAEFAAGNV